MRRRPTRWAWVVLLLIGIVPPPSTAVDHQELTSGWDLYPEKGMSHPKKVKLATVADGSIELTACHLWYAHSRDSLSASQGFPEISNGGRLNVSLKVVGQSDNRKIASYSKDIDSNGMAVVGWADSPLENQFLAITYGLQTEISAKFPIRVEAGNMLLWTVKFSGAPRLEVDPEGAAPFRDNVWLRTWCESCGTVDRPCKDWWTNDD